MSSETCSVCLENESKYTCPACEAKSCSLECVKRHKLRTECTGKVDPTKFVSKKELSDKESLVNRDYNYLLNFERKIANDISDVKENARKILKRPNAAQNRYPKRQRQDESEDRRLTIVRKHFPNVKETSIKRENTMVIHLPPGMSRSTQNKTGFDKKSSSFTWTIEWAPLGECTDSLTPFLSFRIKESTSLRDAVPLAVLAKSFNLESVDKDKLSFYLDNCVGTKHTYIELDANESVSSALKDAIVLEYPKIYVFEGSQWPEAWQGRVDSKTKAYGLDEGDSETDSSSESDSDSDSSSDSSDSTDDSDSEDEGPEESSSKPATTLDSIDN